MSTASGTFNPTDVVPLIGATFAPQANVPFTVTVGANTSGAPGGLTGNMALIRSQDSGVNWAPAFSQISSVAPGKFSIPAPGSFDITEQRSGVLYALVLLSAPAAAIPYRFDQ